MLRIVRKSVSFLLAAAVLLTAMVFVPELGTVKSSAASWNGTNYGGGELYGYRTFLEAFGIDYDTYMKWLDDHDADSPNPNYYLGTPYAHNDHRNPRGDCRGAYGDYDEPGVAAMNCTGFVWHVLYKSAVNSGASYSQYSRLKVMWQVPVSWSDLGIYRIYFNNLDEAYKSGVMEKGDLMWIYGSSDNHNAIFYGDSPTDWIYWDSAGERNRYCEIHAIGECRGLWVAKVSQPNYIELQIDTTSGDSTCFGAKYSVFSSRSEAQAAADNPDNDAIWDKRIGTIALDSKGHGCLRTQSAPSKAELWKNGVAQTGLSYFRSSAQRVSSKNTYYAVQWSPSEGVMEENSVHVFTDSGDRTSSGYRIFSFNAPRRVATPKLSEVKSTFDGVRLSWKAVKGAERYRLYRRTAGTSWVRIGQTASASFIDSTAVSGRDYIYTIRCVDKFGTFTSEYNETGWKVNHKVLDTPALTYGRSEADGIRLKWTPVDGAERYRVYFKNSRKEWVRVAETANTEYLDGIVTAGNSYVYTIRCVDSQGDFVSDFNHSGWKRTYNGVATPEFTGAVSEPDGVRLTWDAVEGASAYRLYCKNSSGSWSKMGETADTEYFDGVVTAGSTYTYTIRCLNSSGSLSSGFDEEGLTQKYDGIDTPVITGAVSEEGGVRLSWTPVENAYKYRVYYKNSSGSWVKMTETAGTEYIDDDVRPGKTYVYTVRCVNSVGGFTSDYDKNGVSHTFTLSTPHITKAESVTDGVKLTWNKITGAYGYRVFYYGRNGWTRLGLTTGTSFIDTDVTSGTTYTYTVRCIDKNGDYTSDYDREGFDGTFIATPKIRSAVIRTEGVVLSWDAVKGAYGYRVFYYGRNGWTRLGVTTGTSFTDTDVRSGSTYTYTVRCIDRDENYISDYDSKGYKATYISTPQVKSIYSNNIGIVLNWDKIEGAASYRVFRRGNSGWERLGSTSAVTFTDRTAENGRTYTYTVRCMDKNGNYISDYNSVGFTAAYIKYLDFTLSNEDEGVKLSWQPTDGVSAYRVYRMNDSGEWKYAANVAGSEWIDRNVSNGVEYTYSLRGTGENGSFVTGYLTDGKKIVREEQAEVQPEIPQEDVISES